MSKLTKQFVESKIESPTSGQRFYRDEDVPGFAVRVTPKSKSYIFERRVGGANRRITIGKCDLISFDTARTQACIMLGEIAKGNDPKTGKQIHKFDAVTLRGVLNKFLEVKPLRRDTKRNYIFSLNKHFHDWLDIPITSITKDMVEHRHHFLTVSPNRLGTPGHGRANAALKRLIKINPVTRLTRNRRWHRIHPRQGIIPDHKLKDWYRAVSDHPHEVARDFMLFLLLTGMRFGETRKLRWSHVDFENGILVVPREITKCDREHRLPLSNFLIDLLRKRLAYRKHPDWIFPSTRKKQNHLSESAGMVKYVRKKSGIYFTLHDLRRTFLTMAAKLDVPPYALKRLVNHSVSNDMTSRYIVLDAERLRSHMERITNAFLDLLAISTRDSSFCSSEFDEPNESIQLIIELNTVTTSRSEYDCSAI